MILLNTIRRKKEYTQEYVAKLLDVSQVSVSQWEQGVTYPHPEKIAKLAEIYEVTSDEIIKAITQARLEKEGK